MSQSDSEVALSDDDEVDKPLYPYQRFYHNAADKARIDELPLIEREQAIAQRSEEADRHEQDRQLHRLVAQRQKENKKIEKKAKRKADDAGLDESQRKSARQRTKVGGEQKGAIDRYKQQRAEKNQRDEARRQNRRSASPVDDYSEDAQGESDEYDEPRIRRRSPTPIKDDPPVELVDVNRARIGRENFVEVMQNPGFDGTATGCFVRINLGPGKVPGVNTYRLCQIKGIKKGRPYAMSNQKGQQILTDKYVIAAHGKAERPWSFLETSMQRFTNEEWNRYRMTMANEEISMPTKGFVERKLDELNKLIGHKWKDEEISAKIAAQKELMAMVTKSNEKDEIQDQIIEARRTRKYDLVEELEEKLQNIVPMKLAMGTTLFKKEETRTNAEQERLAALNRKNNQLNSENIRKAQLAEMHARRMKQQQKRTASPAPGLKPNIDDLFDPTSDISRASTPGPGAGTPANGTPLGTPRSSTPVLSKAVKKRNGMPVIRRALMDDEIISQMDLGLDIEL